MIHFLAGVFAQLLRALRVDALRMARVPDDDGRCGACGSAEVDVLAPGITRCRGCGYEGGPGVAHRARENRRAALQALPDDQRAETGRSAASQAQLLFELAISDLERFRPRVLVDRDHYAKNAVILEDGMLTHALSQAHEAYAWLEKSADCLGVSLGADPPDEEPGMWVNQLGEIDAACVIRDVDRALASSRRGLLVARTLTG